jgi:hypothetical protein
MVPGSRAGDAHIRYVIHTPDRPYGSPLALREFKRSNIVAYVFRLRVHLKSVVSLLPVFALLTTIK